MSETHLLQKAGGMHPISVITIMFQEYVVIRALVINPVVPFKTKIMGYTLLLSKIQVCVQLNQPGPFRVGFKYFPTGDTVL